MLRSHFAHVAYCFVLFCALTASALRRNSTSDSAAADAAALPNIQPAGALPVTHGVAEDFVRATRHCQQQESLSPALRTQVDAFEYADVSAVHRHLHCVWRRMDLWHDGDGFQVNRIVDLYRTRANVERLVPTLTSCNRNERHEEAARWCYRATQCILDTVVGQWFKDDVQRVKIQSQIPNGH